ncbi:MAG: hypothetical protein Q9165_000453 [Trypethelium subeluteriae]
MAYYDNSAAWSAQGRQQSWEQQAPPSRSGTSSRHMKARRAGSDENEGTSSTVQRDDSAAFGSQFEEVDRAADNLMKSGKMFGAMSGSAGRRDSMPLMGGPRSFPEFERGGPQRHHSVSDYEGARPGSSHNLQNFYANQRYQPRPSEAEQAMQQKRRMAAQRERELRNYHQEQHIDGSGVAADMSGAKSDRSMSPNTMNEEERRELIARQHRALYGNDSTLYTGDNPTPRQGSQDARISTSATGVRGNSPLAFDPFGSQSSASATEPPVQMPAREQLQKQDAAITGKQSSRRNSNSSPSSQPTSFGLFENAQQSSRTSTSSPGGSPPLQGPKSSTATAGPAPIGTRPTQNQTAPAPGLSKRSTTPLPSPLSYGFSANEQGASNSNNNERSTSAASNPNSNVPEKSVGLGGWGSNSGVWGTGKNLGVQASVWG